MDFGSLVCTRDAPSCQECPAQKFCAFFPLYTTKKEKVLFVMEKREEKGVSESGKQIPNRIFRGRIVEFVRRNEGKEISKMELGKGVKKDYTPEDEEWLLGLCEKLKREGLLDYTLDRENLTVNLAGV